MKKRLLIIAVVGFVLAAPAEARKSGLYIGASLGASTISVTGIDDELGEIDFSDTGTGWKAFMGYRFLKFFAVEASYVDFGTTQDTVGDEDVNVDIGVTGWDAFGLGILPIGPVDVFAKVGGIRWNSDIKAYLGDQSDTESDKGSDIAYGIGVGVRVWRLSIRGEFEMFDIEDSDDVYMVTVGAAFTF